MMAAQIVSSIKTINVRINWNNPQSVISVELTASPATIKKIKFDVHLVLMDTT